MPKNSSENAASDSQVYGRLLSYVTPYWAAFVFSMLGFVLYSLSNVGIHAARYRLYRGLAGRHGPFLVDTQVEPVLRGLFGEGDSLNRSVIPIAIVFIAVTRGFGTFIGNYFITFIGTNLVHNLRRELFDHLLRLPSSFFDRNSMGHLVAKVTFHCLPQCHRRRDRRSAPSSSVKDRPSSAISRSCSISTGRLALIFLAVAPFIAFLVDYAGKRFRRISERIQDSMGDADARRLGSGAGLSRRSHLRWHPVRTRSISRGQ
ncbi:MAG: ABC transporter transmembrane domain-containing protein [Gammaproteobacteria bacterium]|nr:ABC transporter transmembrane domain-containing protein [Gammaproteobacteria bacterium]